MRILFLDIASRQGCIACVTEDVVAASRSIDRRIGDDELIPVLEEVMREAGWQMSDLTHLACVIGPGGFMSLRVAVSLMNALSWCLKIPSAGMHLSDVYQARLQYQIPHPTYEIPIWLHSTKKRELFIRSIGTHHRLWLEPTHVTLEKLEKDLPKEFHWMGELLPEHQEWIKAHGGHTMRLRSLEEILPSFLAKQSYHQKILTPWYGREG